MMADFLTWIRAEWDRVAGFGLVGLGGLAVLLGYLGVSRHDDVPSQLAYLASGGLGGVVLVAVGATLLVSANLKDEWRKLDPIEALLDDLAARGPDLCAGQQATSHVDIVTEMPDLADLAASRTET